jgi:hypothetical protein
MSNTDTNPDNVDTNPGVMTVSEALSLLENKAGPIHDIERAGTNIAEFLYSVGMRMPHPLDDKASMISSNCPVAEWLRRVTGEWVTVGMDHVFVFDVNPLENDFPMPKEEHRITTGIKEFILYLDYFTRSWEKAPLSQAK